MRRFPGNGITEYMLPMALIGVVSIAAVITLAGNIQQTFHTLKGDLLRHATAAQKPLPDQPSEPEVSTMAEAPLKEKGASFVIDTPAPSTKSTVKNLVVAGTNGTTSELSSKLEQLAKSLLKQNAITPEDADILQKMAQSGYQISTSQLAMENAFASNSGSMTIDGKTYTLAQAAELHGFANTENSMLDSKSNVQNLNTNLASPTLRPLLELYQQAALTKAMQNPDVNKTVTQLVKHIAGIDDAFSWSVASLTTDESGKISNSRIETLNSSVSTNFSNLTENAIAGAASANTSSKASSICQESNTNNCR